MRKSGFGCIVFGGACSLLLYLVRQGAWFRAKAATNLSEAAEFIESAFWAGLIVLGIGFVLLLLSLRKKVEAQTEEDEQQDEYDSYVPQEDAVFGDDAPYAEQDYGNPYAEQDYDNSYAEQDYGNPYAEQDYDYFREGQDFDEPAAPREPVRDVWQEDSDTRRVPELPRQEQGWVCEICGCRNPAYSGICAVCGSARGSSL